MKTKTIFYTLLITTTVWTLNGCSQSKKEAAKNHEEHAQPATTEATPSAPTFSVDGAFQQQLSSVFTSYVSLKDAFVATDVAKVKAEAATTAQTLAKADMKLLTGAAHNDWMNYLGGMETSLKEIQAASDIEQQRKAFSNLSDNLYKSIKAYGLGGTPAFYEFCPMAFDNQGAYWLSDQEAIRNPYFGDKMLKCGSVQEKLN